MKKRTAAAITVIMIFVVLSLAGTAFGTDSVQVMAAQQKLIDSGYSIGTVDGVMGPATVRALKYYQVDQGLGVTGTLDQPTLGRMGIPTARSIIRTQGKNGRRLALLVGNGAYRHGGRLPNPVNDVEAMARVLRSLGFGVTTLTNCTQTEMKKAIDTFGRQMKNQEVGLFFYAGHGVQVRGHNYLIPVDCKLENENQVDYDCVRVGRVLAGMESAGVQTNIVILDACRDNPFERSWNRGSNGQGLAFINAPSGSFIAYATSPGKTASDGRGTNGLYTSALVKHIATPGIAIEKVFKLVRTEVKNRSGAKQIPWESTSLQGDFYFAATPGGSAVPAITNPPQTGSVGGQVDALLAQRRQWETWQAAMSGDYEKLKALERDDAIPVTERKRLFKAFLSSYAADNIYSSRDEALRLEAQSVLDRLDSSGREYVDSVTGMAFVWVPGGCYQMGSNKGESDETPVHEVCVDGFRMGKYEVTNRQYRKFKPSHSSGDYKGVSLNGDDQPAVNVSWNNAKAFISWLNGKTGKTFSLPTEAQWEYACRAGTGTMRYWGDGEDEACAYANVHDLTSKRINTDFTWENFNCDDGYSASSPVGRFKPNNFGLHDMLGNVWEWCEDGYDGNAYSKHERNNPVITKGSNRVLRGGSWLNSPRGVRCAYRLGGDPSYAGRSYGFRLVLSGHK